jgi:hypothetical protein
MQNLYFCIWWGLRVTYCIPVLPGCEMLTHRFLCSSRPGAISIKKMLGHIMQNLCFRIPWDLRVT